MLELDPVTRWAIAIKHSTSRPAPSRDFHTACDELETTGGHTQCWIAERPTSILSRSKSMPVPTAKVPKGPEPLHRLDATRSLAYGWSCVQTFVACPESG